LPALTPACPACPVAPADGTGVKFFEEDKRSEFNQGHPHIVISIFLTYYIMNFILFERLFADNEQVYEKYRFMNIHKLNNLSGMAAFYKIELRFYLGKMLNE